MKSFKTERKKWTNIHNMENERNAGKLTRLIFTCIVREEGCKENHRPQQGRTFGATEKRAQQKAHIDHGQTERLEVNKHINFVAVLEHAAAGDQGDQDGDKSHLDESGDQPR